MINFKQTEIYFSKKNTKIIDFTKYQKKNLINTRFVNSIFFLFKTFIIIAKEIRIKSRKKMDFIIVESENNKILFFFKEGDIFLIKASSMFKYFLLLKIAFKFFYFLDFKKTN